MTARIESKRSIGLKERDDGVNSGVLYAQLSGQESRLDQRLFYDWERATLLATELGDPAGHRVLRDATLLGDL